jgi:hypothetical protein
MWHKDRYTVGLLILFGGLLLSFYFDNKQFKIGSGIFGITGFIYLLRTMNSRSRIVSNNFNGKLFVKRENEIYPFELNPKQQGAYIDGIKDASGEIFKIGDGMDVVINSSGKVSFAGPGSIIATLLSKNGGGYNATLDSLNWKPLSDAK